MISWTGIPWKTLLMVGGGAAIVISALYILRMRKRRVVVPYLPFWRELIRETPLYSFWQKFRRLLSWLLQIFILTLLLLALADPRFKSELLNARYFAIIVDLSASMKAVESDPSPRKAGNPPPPTAQRVTPKNIRNLRISIALQKAEEFIRSLYPNDRAVLIAMSHRAEAIVPFTSDKNFLLRGLSQLRPLDTPASLPPAFKLAGDLLRDKKNRKIILISDGIFSKESWNKSLKIIGNIPFELIKVGRSGENVGIVNFSARRLVEKPSDFSVYIELKNFTSRAKEGFLELYSGGGLSETIFIQLKPGESWKRVLGPYAGEDQILTARWVPKDGRDDFSIDDRAFAVLPPAPKLRVASVGEENLYLQAALLADSRIISRNFPCGEKFDAAEFDVVIYNNCRPDPNRLPRRWLVFGPKGELPFFRVEVKRGKPLFMDDPIITEVNSRHPVMRYLHLEDLNISSSIKFLPVRGVEVLASSFGSPVFLAYSRGRFRAVAVGFSLNESDFVLRVAFPLFLNNAFNWLMNWGEKKGFSPSFRSGETAVLSNLAGEFLRVEGPGGERFSLAVVGGRAIFRPERIGIYRINDGEKVLQIAVNLFNYGESGIDPAQGVELVGRKGGGEESLAAPYSRPLWWYLTVAVALLFLLEWITYNRRVTV